MNDKTASFVVGIISSTAAFELWESILMAAFVALIGGLVSWLTKELLDYIKRRIKKQ